MEKFDLTAQRREQTGKLNKKIRKDDKIPAIVYGAGLAPQMLVLGNKEFQKIYQKAGESSLVNLQVDKDVSFPVLIQDVQLHPVTDKFLHIDFQKVDLTKTITTEISLKFQGKSPAVAEQGGILITSIESVNVECLPGDLVHEISVDLGSLKTFDDQIRIQDIAVPQGIIIKDKLDVVVATVTPPRTEEELKALDTDVVEDVASVEGLKKKEAEDEADQAKEGEAKDEPKDSKQPVEKKEPSK